MSFEKVEKEIEDIAKQTVKNIEKSIKDIDKRIDISKNIKELTKDKIPGALKDIDKRIDVNKNLIDRFTGNVDATDRNFDIKNFLKEIKNIVSDKEVLNEFFKENPWFKERIDKLKNSKISDQERQDIERQVKIMKGKYFEFCIKKYCEKQGLKTLPNKTIDTEKGKTVTDYLGKNETNKDIKIFNKTIRPGDTIHIELKAGDKNYINNQKEHINKQLKTDFDHKFLITTDDAVDIKNDLKKICDDNNANLIITDLSAKDINKILGV